MALPPYAVQCDPVEEQVQHAERYKDETAKLWASLMDRNHLWGGVSLGGWLVEPGKQLSALYRVGGFSPYLVSMVGTRENTIRTESCLTFGSPQIKNAAYWY